MPGSSASSSNDFLGFATFMWASSLKHTRYAEVGYPTVHAHISSPLVPSRVVDSDGDTKP
jgi:hypothetical protein